MKEHFLSNSEEFATVYCDLVDRKTFKNENEFKVFVKMHPSSFFSLKEINNNGSITAYFNMYVHKIWDENIITERLSYNSNPIHDNELKRYYDLIKKENQLMEDLKFIEESRRKFEIQHPI